MAAIRCYTVAMGCVLLALVLPARTDGQSPRGATRPSAPAFEVPAWAFPLPATPPPAAYDSVRRHRVPGSGASFTEAQAQNRFGVADWYPASHPAMPDVVARGRKPGVAACAFCHLPDGIGRPENAMLAGLPAAYIVAQLVDIRSRARLAAWKGPHRPTENMRAVADSVTDDETARAAQYFAALRPRRRSRVIEARQIPRVTTVMGLYARSSDRGVEPLGRRLIEMPMDLTRHELHDARADYIAYVPPGSIARGRALATTTRANGSPSCASCHGPQLRGMGAVPSIAGRAPSYILRQLLAFRTEARSSAAAAPMRAVAATLGIGDMIAAAAYAGSRDP
jgi:cytochrome c553